MLVGNGPQSGTLANIPLPLVGVAAVSKQLPDKAWPVGQDTITVNALALAVLTVIVEIPVGPGSPCGPVAPVSPFGPVDPRSP